MSRLQEAMAAVRANPKDSMAWSNLGELLLEAGQIEKSKESFQRALQLDTNNWAAQEGLSAALTAGTAAQAAPPHMAGMPSDTFTGAQVPGSSGPPGLAGSLMGHDIASDVPPEPQQEGLGIEVNWTPRSEVGEAGGLLRGEAPPMPQKPSEGRVKFGLTLMGMLLFACFCSVVLGLAGLLANFSI